MDSCRAVRPKQNKPQAPPGWKRYYGSGQHRQFVLIPYAYQWRSFDCTMQFWRNKGGSYHCVEYGILVSSHHWKEANKQPFSFDRGHLRFSSTSIIHIARNKLFRKNLFRSKSVQMISSSCRATDGQIFVDPEIKHLIRFILSCRYWATKVPVLTAPSLSSVSGLVDTPFLFFFSQ